MNNIQIQLNGEVQFLPALTLEDCLAHFNIQTQNVAVALNNTLILKSEFKTTLLKNDDKLEIVQAVFGG